MLASDGLPSMSSPCGLAWLPCRARAISKVVDFIPSGSNILRCMASSYAAPSSLSGYTRCAPTYPAAAAIRLLYWKTSPNLLVGCMPPSRASEDSGVAFDERLAMLVDRERVHRESR